MQHSLRTKLDGANSAIYASAIPAQRESEETTKLHTRSQIADSSSWAIPECGASEARP
jgi:hypothetical protein